MLVSALCAAFQLAAMTVPRQPAPQAARSVHLMYQATASTAFYNEVTVDESQPGSYFEVCGFRHGYFGIQELTNGKGKVVLFSVWDPGNQNDPKSVAADRQVKLLSKGAHVRAGRFGGEGTGGQSFYNYDWRIGETCRFLLRATVRDQKTDYAAYFFDNHEHAWEHVATFETYTAGEALDGYYSFIEDFRRDGKSAGERRRAHFGNGWVQAAAGDWLALTRAKFTGDSTPTNNVDAGTDTGRFYLATGGDTHNSRPIGSIVLREPVPIDLPPASGDAGGQVTGG